MEFRIADSFLDSLNRLTSDEKKLVKTTVFDLQANSADPGLSFHKLDKARDANFWSVRVGRDIRVIVHKTGSSLLICYADHHDKAYAWAERRKLETHPRTGAAQMVEIREKVEEIVIRRFVEPEAPVAIRKVPFAETSDDVLLGFGVPSEWLKAVQAADEESLLDVAEHLPAEAAEALLELAVGGTPKGYARDLTKQELVLGLSRFSEEGIHLSIADDGYNERYFEGGGSDANLVELQRFEASFKHPDAKRRFSTIESAEELQRALEFPWDKWTVFLHPKQRTLVEREQSGPARVSGSAGTGKTIVALHRAVHLAKKDPDGRVALATFSEPLANSLATRLRRLISNAPRLGDRIDVVAVPALGARLYKSLVGPLNLAPRETVVQLVMDAAAKAPDPKFSLAFLISEWDQVVDAWQLDSWKAYRDVGRLGRKTRLREERRKALWEIFEEVRAGLSNAGVVTEAGMFARLTAAVSRAKNPPYEFAVIDEAQDISIPQLKFFAALGGNRPNALFFAGDLGQRIFQQVFSWKALGIDVRGRARTLRVNYRTSHQIRAQADRLLEGEIADVDGNAESRRDAISVFNGVPPSIETFPNQDAEVTAVAEWIAARVAEGVAAHEIGVFVRSVEQLQWAKAAVEAVEVPYKVLDDRVDATGGFVAVGTMHLAKGLEFRAVVVMACDDEVIPLQARIDTVRRFGFERGIRHGAPAALCGVYSGERFLVSDGGRAGVGILG